MVSRTLDRRKLRKEADEAGQSTQTVPDAALAEAPAGKPRRKAPTTPRARKPRPKKEPPRMRARWGVFDGGMKQVAVFDYNQRAAADTKLTDLLATKKGTYFLQLVKEPMAESEPTEASEVG